MTRAQTLDPALEGQIVFDLTPMCIARGYVHRTPHWRGKIHMLALARDTGLTYGTIFDLVKFSPGVSSVSFDVLGRLCHALQCQPGDLLKFVTVTALPKTTIHDFFRANPDGDPYAEVTIEGNR